MRSFSGVIGLVFLRASRCELVRHARRLLQCKTLHDEVKPYGFGHSMHLRPGAQFFLGFLKMAADGLDPKIKMFGDFLEALASRRQAKDSGFSRRKLCSATHSLLIGRDQCFEF